MLYSTNNKTENIKYGLVIYIVVAGVLFIYNIYVIFLCAALTHSHTHTIASESQHIDTYDDDTTTRLTHLLTLLLIIPSWLCWHFAFWKLTNELTETSKKEKNEAVAAKQQQQQCQLQQNTKRSSSQSNSSSSHSFTRVFLFYKSFV